MTAFLAAHANPNAADQSGNTVLMHAAVGGQIAVVDRMLGSGAAVAARNVQDWSALDFAEVNGLPEVAARLKESGATGLRRSAITECGDLTFVQRPGVAHKDLYAGWPDIAVAAVKTSPSLLDSLLARREDPNGLMPEGTPVLTAVVMAGPPRSVDALMSAGAVASRPDRRGDSALLLAIRSGREDVVKVLLARGVSPDEHTTASEPTLVAAARSRRGSIVRLLIDAHAHLDSQDAHGMDAFMLVAQSADVDLFGACSKRAREWMSKTSWDARRSGIRPMPDVGVGSFARPAGCRDR